MKPRVKAFFIQQLHEAIGIERMMYVPMLRINGDDTTIAGESTYASKSGALGAARAARKAFMQTKGYLNWRSQDWVPPLKPVRRYVIYRWTPGTGLRLHSNRDFTTRRQAIDACAPDLDLSGRLLIVPVTITMKTSKESHAQRSRQR